MIMVIIDKDEFYILTGEEMEYIKKKAGEILKVLPEEYNTSLLIIGYLKETMEETTGRKIKGIKVI